MTKIEIVAAAWALFQTHPKEEKVYATSDGMLFFAKNHAESHAGGLEKKDLFEVERDMAESAKAAGLLDKEEEAKAEGPEEQKQEPFNLNLDDLKNDPVNPGADETKEQETVNPGADETKEQETVNPGEGANGPETAKTETSKGKTNKK